MGKTADPIDLISDADVELIDPVPGTPTTTGISGRNHVLVIV